MEFWGLTILTFISAIYCCDLPLIIDVPLLINNHNALFYGIGQSIILKNYYKYCERIEYASPLYCATKPTNENYECSNENRKRYFWLVLKCHEKTIIKNLWFSAVTEEGFLLFIKTKLKLEKVDEKVRVTLLQQTTYYKGRGEVVALYR